MTFGAMLFQSIEFSFPNFIYNPKRFNLRSYDHNHTRPIPLTLIYLFLVNFSVFSKFYIQKLYKVENNFTLHRKHNLKSQLHLILLRNSSTPNTHTFRLQVYSGGKFNLWEIMPWKFLAVNRFNLHILSSFNRVPIDVVSQYILTISIHCVVNDFHSARPLSLIFRALYLYL